MHYDYGPGVIGGIVQVNYIKLEIAIIMCSSTFQSVFEDIRPKWYITCSSELSIEVSNIRC